MGTLNTSPRSRPGGVCPRVLDWRRVRPSPARRRDESRHGYLVGMVAVAMRCSRRTSVATSLLSVAAFDFFCVPPYLTFRVTDYQYLITFSAMLIMALVISTPTARIRNHAAEVTAREARNETLYRLSRRLAG